MMDKLIGAYNWGKLLGFHKYWFHSKCCDSTSLHFNEIWKFTFLWLIFVRYLAVHISVGMVSKPVAETAPEFQIQQEDFPALPGAQSESQRERERLYNGERNGREILERENYQRNTVTLREWMSDLRYEGKVRLIKSEKWFYI